MRVETSVVQREGTVVARSCHGKNLSVATKAHAAIEELFYHCQATASKHVSTVTKHATAATHVYATQNSELLGFWTLSIVRYSEKTREHNVSETETVSVLR
jgi:hypothetical protein